ncbi:MAG: hypothetical protein DIU62_001380 [Pseudomonadota bacterium]|jgi:ribosomal protein L7/L12
MDAAIVFSLIAIAIALYVCIKSRPKQRSVAKLPLPSEAVKSSLVTHGQIAAIRCYRNETGASLYEARKVIEHYRARLHQESS